jgi:hypothetical protein
MAAASRPADGAGRVAAAGVAPSRTNAASTQSTLRMKSPSPVIFPDADRLRPRRAAQAEAPAVEGGREPIQRPAVGAVHFVQQARSVVRLLPRRRGTRS